jgi:hypothetical protein
VYLAAAAATHLVMLTGPEALKPLSGPRSDLLCPQWEALHDGAHNLWPELRKVGPDSLDHIAKAQGTFARHAAPARFDALLASLDAGTEAGRHNHAFLLSCTCRPASA